MKIAPLFGCAVTTAIGVVNNDAKIKVGQSVVIFGIGGVGLNIVQAASLVSATPIVGVDLIEQKLEMGKKFGLSHGFIGGGDELNNKICNVVGSQGADAEQLIPYTASLYRPRESNSSKINHQNT